MATGKKAFGQQWLNHEVSALLAEGVAAATKRERTTFDEFAFPVRELVLFGAGGLGRRTLAALRQAGVEPVAFADSNSKLWNTTIEGLPVLSPESAARTYGTRACFVITIWSGLATDRMADRQRPLRALGCQHVIPFPQLFWKYPELLLPHYTVDVPHKVHEQAAQVKAGARLWADDASRREYLAQLRFRLYGDFDCLPAPVAHPVYFPPDLWSWRDDEVFVDCGAYDGDTIASLLEQTSRVRSIFGFEPDPENFAKLQASVAHISPAISVVNRQAAVGATSGRVSFVASAGMSSRVGSGELTVECVSLDEALAGAAPSYIKMDIEGSELDALAGAAQLIRRHTPLLAISAYHSQDHLWRVPLFIQSLDTRYRFFLRPYHIECWDLVCYAVPENRLLPHKVQD